MLHRFGITTHNLAMARGFLLLYHWGLSHPPFWRVFLFWFKDFAFGFKFWFQVLIFDFKFYYSVSEVSSAMRSGSSKSSIWQPSTLATLQSWYTSGLLRCGSSVLPGGKVPGGLCLRPCSVRLWGYWCVILSCGSPPF